MTKVMIATKAKDLKDRVMAVTKKCYELKGSYPNFGWEFFTSCGELHFTAYYRDGEFTGDFVFPIRSIEVEKKYSEIMRQLEDLKLSALIYEKKD